MEKKNKEKNNWTSRWEEFQQKYFEDKLITIENQGNKNKKKNNWKTEEPVHEMTWTWLRRENLNSVTEFLLIEAQINTTKNNYVKV